MACDLEALFADVNGILPHLHDPNADWITLSPSTLPKPPETLSTDRLWMRGPTLHFYNGFPIPGIDLCLDKSACRHLGLLILSVLLHPEPVTVELRLTHPSSEIQYLRVRYEHADNLTGLTMVPAQFTYATEEVYRHPWVRGHTWTDPDPHLLPSIEVTTADEGFVDWQPSDMDTVVGFGNAYGAAALAELLLNASLDSNDQDEFHLEGEPGYRGVGPASSELHIFLPGSLGYFT